MVNSHKPLYRCIECIAGRLYNSICLCVDNFHVKIRYTYTHLFHMFLKVVLVMCYQIVWMPRKYIFNMTYTIKNSIEHSQITKCIQYNIHVTKSCELPTYVFKSCIGFMISNCVNEKNAYMFFKSCIGFVLSNCLNAKKKMHLKYEIHNSA